MHTTHSYLGVHVAKQPSQNSFLSSGTTRIDRKDGLLDTVKKSNEAFGSRGGAQTRGRRPSPRKSALGGELFGDEDYVNAGFRKRSIRATV